jgi:formate dehydrogenase subunit beta
MENFSKLSIGETVFNEVLSGFFKAILTQGIADAVLVPAHRPVKGVMQTLITDPAQLDSADPFAPVMPVNSAKLVSKLTHIPSGRPIAVVMRSCEIRALVELIKLKQATSDDLIIIGIDCIGRYENRDYLKLEQNGINTQSFLKNALSGQGTCTAEGIDVAAACRICEFPVADNVDIRLCVIGASPGTVYAEWVSEKGRTVRDTLAINVESAPSDRDSAVKKIQSEHLAERDKVFAELYKQVNTMEKLRDHLAGCVNCYNCRVACPVCYCKECVFVTDTFRHPGDQYMAWGDTRGAVKMPAETILYHTTRMTHISTLCVGCGQCSSACPNDIQLAELFRSVALRTQARFDYLPGRSVDEAQPLAVFHDDELLEVTGQKK